MWAFVLLMVAAVVAALPGRWRLPRSLSDQLHAAMAPHRSPGHTAAAHPEEQPLLAHWNEPPPDPPPKVVIRF